MASVQRAMVLLMVMASLQVSLAAVYKVGDSSGWTTIGNVDYKKWAASKTFHVGDILLFSYNAQFHNVMQVTQPDYQSCNATAQLALYTTGNDSITIKKNAHYYFLCGVPGHCQAGQKLDFNVASVSSPVSAPVPAPTANPTPTPTSAESSPTTSPSGTTMAPAPSSRNSAPVPSKGFLGKLALALAIVAGFAY